MSAKLAVQATSATRTLKSKRLFYWEEVGYT